MTKHSNIIDLLIERTTEHPARCALRFLQDGENIDAEVSFAELHRQVFALARELRLHAAAGERALLLYHTGPQYVTALLACFAAGIIAVPAFPPLSGQPQHQLRMLSIVHNAKPKLLLTQRSELAAIQAVVGALGEFRNAKLLATDELGVDGVSEGAAWPSGVAAADVAMLQYTSGSTSAPKGVMLTHGNLMANEAVISQAFSMSPDDVVVSWLPLFHDMGLIGTLLQPLYSGCTAVLMPQQRFMERPRRWLEAISRFGASGSCGIVSGAPDFAYRLAALRSDPSVGSPLDLSRWRLAFCGAEPIRAETLQGFARRFARVGFDAAALYPCYGLAESTLLVTGRERGSGAAFARFATSKLSKLEAVADEQGAELVACGHSWPEHEVLIAEPETGERLAEDRVGEILVAGPSVAQGYWQNSTATESTFVTRSGARYLRTGDLGFLHQGNLFVTGRAKDMIIIRGQNLFPQDLEQLVEDQNEAVRKGRVVAFALEQDGQEQIGVAAEVNPRLQKFVNLDSVRAGISEIISRAVGQVPALVVLLQPGAVPITSSGKLQRAACRAGCLEGSLPVLSSEAPGAAS